MLYIDKCNNCDGLGYYYDHSLAHYAADNIMYNDALCLKYGCPEKFVCECCNGTGEMFNYINDKDIPVYEGHT